MDEVLANACRQYGWHELYTLILGPGHVMEQRTGRTEFDGLSPFPGSTDKHASFSYNIANGLWNDQHMRDKLQGVKNNGGNIVQAHAFLNFYTIDQYGRVHGDFDAAERDLRIKLGLAQPIDIRWFEACRARLSVAASPHHTDWLPYKPWKAEILAKLGVGYDPGSERFVIGTRDHKGELINAKLYRPGPGYGPKSLWKNIGLGPQNVPWPHQAAFISKKPFFFVEGEPDAISLMSIGILAVTGVMGANDLPNMGPFGHEFCAGRDVVVCGDPDTAGEIYASKAISMFQPYASSVRQFHVPSWDGMPAKRDISDYIMHLLHEGRTPDEIRKIIQEIANKSDAIGLEARYDMDPIYMPFEEALDTNNYNRRFATKVRIVSIAGSHHMIPLNMEIRCRQDKSYCGSCPMFNRNGLWIKSIDTRSQLALDTSMVDTDKQFRMIKRDFNIPEQCPSVRAVVQSTADVQIVQITSPQINDNLDQISADDVHARRAEMFLISRNNGKLESGFDYDIRGFMYAIGKNQKTVFVCDKAEKVVHVSQAEHLSPEDCFRLRKIFKPAGLNILDSLKHIADDLSQSVTGIRMRTDMHLLYRAVFHSAIEFNLAGEHVARGWLEAFVLGDTRCGKSAAFKAMSNWYGVGVLVDCKNQTVPGMLGAVETSAITGERYVIPGLVPLNDQRGPICYDEFTGAKYGRSALMEALSSTRAEGVVSITKAASARFKARVRGIWLANPGDGRLLAETPGTGIERIRKLVGQPEDIARFDIGMAVSQGDVDLEVLLNPIPLREPMISQNDYRLHLEWCRTRKATDFIWEDEAIVTLANVTRRMIQTFDQSIPLVESATQRLKIAKLAIANALSTFSTPDGSKVIVMNGHVMAAYYMLNMWYTKASFGYHTYSERKRIENGIENETEVQELLEKEFGTFIIQYLYNLQRMDKFTESTFNIVCPSKSENNIGIMRTLLSNRCIESVDASNSFRLTKAFVKWIDEYLGTREPKPRSTENNENKSII